ncbi:MAG: dynamin family protein [Deltaproteobacteria bacterium]|jgi:hypothetical protein|nr:dynamin family protein [Deltaproteobacteria bacterium]
MPKPLIEYLDRSLKLAASLDRAAGGEAGAQKDGSGKAMDAKAATGTLIRVFESMRRKVEENLVTVGFIGITSSGKSSVINALIGSPLLVQRVKPSSNIVVGCRKAKGTGTQIEIMFKDDRPPVTHRLGGSGIESEEKLAALIKSYSDETENKNNKEQVDLIRISTTRFRLGEGVELADTPGLKAYNYEQHADLTWAFMAPLVDIAIFLCTAKTESDADNMEALKKLLDGDKETIIVQNMIDSVRPELGRGGEVRKTTEENLKTLYDRLSDIVSGISSGRGSRPPIFQVSAKWASSPDAYGKSGFPELVTCLEDRLAKCHRTLERKRKARLLEEIAKVVSDGKGDDFQAAARELKEAEREIRSIEDLMKGMGGAYQGFRLKYSEIGIGIERKLSYYRDEKRFENVNMVESEAQRLADGFDDFINQSFRSVIDLATDASNKATGFCNYLGLEEKDFRGRHQKSTSSARKIYVPKEEKTRTYRVEQSGILGGAKRLFGGLLGQKSWGYTTRNEPYFVVNVKTFRQNILAELDIFKNDISAALRESGDNAHHWFTRLAEEANAKLQRAKATGELRRGLAENAAILGEFKTIHRELTEDLAEHAPETPVTQESESERWRPRPGSRSYEERAETTRPALALARLGATGGGSARLAARNHFLSEAGVFPGGRAVVVGWDALSADLFLANFWFDYTAGLASNIALKAAEQSKQWTGMIIPVKFTPPSNGLPELTVLFAKGNPPPKDSEAPPKPLDFSRHLGPSDAAGSCVFYLADGLQPGESASTLASEAELVAILKSAKSTILTMQNFSVFDGGANKRRETFPQFVESIRYLKEVFAGELKIPLAGFLANCDDLGVTTLGDAYFRHESPLDVLNDARFLERFKKISDPANFSEFVAAIKLEERI